MVTKLKLLLIIYSLSFTSLALSKNILAIRNSSKKTIAVKISKSFFCGLCGWGQETLLKPDQVFKTNEFNRGKISVGRLAFSRWRFVLDPPKNKKRPFYTDSIKFLFENEEMLSFEIMPDDSTKIVIKQVLEN